MSLPGPSYLAAEVPSTSGDLPYTTVQEHIQFDPGYFSSSCLSELPRLSSHLPDYFERLMPEDNDEFPLTTLRDQRKSSAGSVFKKADHPVVWISLLLFTMNEPLIGCMLYLALAFFIIFGFKLLKSGHYLPVFRIKSPLLFCSALFAFVVCATKYLRPIYTNVLVPKVYSSYNTSLLPSGNVQTWVVNKTYISPYNKLFLPEDIMCMLPLYNANSTSSNSVIPSSLNKTRESPLNSIREVPVSSNTRKLSLDNIRNARANATKTRVNSAPLKNAGDQLLNYTGNTTSYGTTISNSSYINAIFETSFMPDNIMNVFKQYYEYEFKLRMRRLELLAEISRLDSKIKSITHFTVPSKKLINARALDTSANTGSQSVLGSPKDTQSDFNNWDRHFSATTDRKA